MLTGPAPLGPLGACASIGRKTGFDVPCHASSLINTIERGEFQGTRCLLPKAEPAAACFWRHRWRLLCAAGVPKDPVTRDQRAAVKFTAFAQADAPEAPMSFNEAPFTVEQTDQHIRLARTYYSRS